MSLLNTILGNPNGRVLRALERQVERVNSLESQISALSDAELRGKTVEFMQRVAEAEGDRRREKTILDSLLPEAFAVMREAMKRVWGERHFDVQIMGGIVLHEGKIAEMKTGEGKTIVAALPIYLNALAGRGAHLVTVNDYLSKHHGEAMGEVYNFLGLSTGVIQGNHVTYKFVKNKDYKHYSEADGSNLLPCSRQEAYACDITYGTNNEYGFDYLRDNMVNSLSDCSQRELYYAIVDEVDSILIDEARTPLIISAPAQDSTGLYQRFAALVPRLTEGDHYIIDEKDKVTSLTDAGIQEVEKLLGIQNIYGADGITMVHHLEEALKAHTLFKKDRDYIVKDGEIIIVDEFTGRLMVGRRYSEGLHQAIEAKEGVEVKQESQTLATISFQNFFRMYQKLAGMTGTAATEAEEFYKIYKLDVVEIPTNRSVARKDLSDRIYKTEKAKTAAIVEEIKKSQEKGQPVLIGTASVEANEELSKHLRRAGVKHEILNAKNHEREAKIIAKAGQKGAVTVATNMAGRGTDIKLGEGVRELGGLQVIGTARHEARRIDNQLRGRAGRQGDPGASQFYVSLEDDLMRIFGGDRIKGLMTTLGLPDDLPIENKMISKSIESAQRKVEGHNFDIRKHLVEYDDVMNKHREVIYRKRQEILAKSAGTYQKPEAEDLLEMVEERPETLKEEILGVIYGETEKVLASTVDDAERAKSELSAIFGDVAIPSLDMNDLTALTLRLYEERENKIGPALMREIEKGVYLRTIDLLWVEHLTTMDELRTGIGLRGYGQLDPLVEYKQEAYRLFQNLIASIEGSLARTILKIEVQLQQPAPASGTVVLSAPNPDTVGNFEEDDTKTERQKIEREYAEKSDEGVTTAVRYKGKTVYDRMQEASMGEVSQVKNNHKPGRNDPCPCGSGLKYKKCHGK